MTSATTIKRGGSNGNNSEGPRKRTVVKTRAKSAARRTPSTFDKAIEWSPFSARAIERAVTIVTLVVIAVALVAVVVLAGVPGFVGTQIAQVAGRAGFAVKRVEVNGIDRMERLTVYAIALDQHSMAMPLVDLARVRNQLMGFGWIKDAQVYRRLPDTLVVDITERTPAAIWQHKQKLSLIDETGVTLELVDIANMPALPLLIGDKANTQAEALTALIGRAPALKPLIASATWVGARRWDIRFQSGEVLALPEGEGKAGKALIKFARIDAMQRLLGTRYARFDMRDPLKFVARFRDRQPSITSPAKLERQGDGPA